MRLLACALLVAAACARHPAPGGADLAARGGDLAAGARDLAVTRDLGPAATGDMIHPLAGISCGNQQCGASSQYCCTADRGASGSCHAVNDFNCADVFFFCDGPEDCPPALGECCVVNGNASCVTPGQCAQMSGSLLCHQVGSCGAGQHCCSAPKGPYALCLDGACP